MTTAKIPSCRLSGGKGGGKLTQAITEARRAIIRLRYLLAWRRGLMTRQGELVGGYKVLIEYYLLEENYSSHSMRSLPSPSRYAGPITRKDKH